MSGKVFLHYMQEELNHVYDQRAWAPNAGELMTRWAGLVAGARAANPQYREVAYGPKPAEKLDLYPAAASGARAASPAPAAARAPARPASARICAGRPVKSRHPDVGSGRGPWSGSDCARRSA